MRAENMRGVSVTHGDYVWIECKGADKEYSGWFLRTLVDGKSLYVNREHHNFTLEHSLVIDSMQTNYIIHKKVSALDAMKGYDFKNTTKEKIEKENLAKPIRKKIGELKVVIEMDKMNLATKEKELVRLMGRLEKIEKGELPKRQYVYGVHTLRDGKQYCWENTRNIDLKVGDVADVVVGAFGRERIVITRIEESYEDRKHNPVIAKVEKLV